MAFPYLASNFSRFKALREEGFKLTSTTTAKQQIIISGILEIPVKELDSDIISYNNPKH